ncbi:E3 ubiquitin-protein ligase RNF13-like [Tubulanus polymorphus]|uniref:E3 ubiquitin-protein ligase RNF13-like n=1 Tax=Tubulanus polymorphus TaxID=672921 RepID=UPI003DA34C9A
MALLVNMLSSGIAKCRHWLLLGLIVGQIQTMLAFVTILNQKNRTVDQMFDAPADFGPSFGRRNAFRGLLVIADPLNACTMIEPPPPRNLTDSYKWIALVRRHDCNFDIKVLNAQKSGYQAVIVYNTGSNDIKNMHGNLDVDIPSCFIGEDDGMSLMDQFTYESGYTIVIDGEMPLNPQYYLLPFAIVVGVCFILMVIFMLVKWIRDIRKRRKSRLSAQHLKKIPVKKFKKGDDYDVCAICLDDYEEGDKMRILPCSHAYHVKCVDPWLLNNKRTCPVCKRKVIPGDDPEDTDSDSDEDHERRVSEVTPLLSAPSARAGNTFESSGLPAAFRNQVLTINDDYSDDDDDERPTLVSILSKTPAACSQEPLRLNGFVDGHSEEEPPAPVHGLTNSANTPDPDFSSSGAVGGVEDDKENSASSSGSRQSTPSAKPKNKTSAKKKKQKRSSTLNAADGTNNEQMSRSLPIETEVLIKRSDDRAGGCNSNHDDDAADVV